MDLSTLDSRTILVLALIVAVACLWLGVMLARGWASWQSRTRNRIARRGEVEAERILADAGFTIVSRQTSRSWAMTIDGRDSKIGVRADLIVERRGRRFVAEVKTGERAPDPRLPTTRRQLLEYSLVFDADCILLVDVPARRIHSITFPSLERR